MSSLLDRVDSITRKAVEKGVLFSVPTQTTIVEDHGIPFIVHVTELQENKKRAKTEQTRKPSNPFLPPDPDLLVWDVGPDHLCVLNKFNVLSHHLLIITRTYEPQEALLTVADFAALATCMNNMEGLGFYNGGMVAGASQAHKHLQLVPLPLGCGPRDTPLDSIIDPELSTGLPTEIPSLGFTHVLIPLGGISTGPYRGEELHRLYCQACAVVGVRDETQPYNLLVTRRWILVVPRTREHWRGISINALGFAGSLLVRNHTDLVTLEGAGPLAVLRSVVGTSPAPARDLDPE